MYPAGPLLSSGQDNRGSSTVLRRSDGVGVAVAAAVAAAMRGLVLDRDETVVSLLPPSVDGCDALVPDVDYVLSPVRLLTAMRSLTGGRM